MKKVWKGAAATIAALSLGVTGFVGATSAYAALEPGKATITIENFDSTHSYKIYQLMTGTVTTENGSEVITNAKWGTGAQKEGNVSTSDLETIAGYATAKDQGTQATIAKTIIDQYVGVGEDNADKGQSFTADPQMQLEPGYYVLIDQSTNLVDNDSKALPIIALLHADEEFKINEKHDTVTTVKKVKENVKDITAPTGTALTDTKVDTGYNDTADYNIGDDVEYEFIGTIPANIDQYDYYKYVFTDTLSAGLTFKSDSVEVYVGDSETPLENESNTNYQVAETTEPRGFTINFGSTAEGSTGLKGVPGVMGEDGTRAAEYIKIKFKATLNSDAVVTTAAGNDGNVNTMKLTYTSNPMADAEGNYEEKDTPEDSVIVFTYKLDFNKVDGTNTGTKLQGAKFVISRNVKNADGEDETQYATADENGKLSGWITTKPTANTGMNNGIFESSEDDKNKGFFGIQGLDDGTYTIEEIAAPEGYSLPSNPTTEFVISGILGTDGKGLQNWANTTNTTNTTNALTAVKVNNNDWATQNITNSKQSNLPETGGMGTVILYTVGGLIVLIAGVGLAIALRRRQA